MGQFFNKKLFLMFSQKKSQKKIFFNFSELLNLSIFVRNLLYLNDNMTIL
jgi:hypothetical protein